LRYHLKHKYGISTNYNTNTADTPWYGMGQGTDNASNRWVIGTDSMSNAYTEQSHSWTIKAPNPTLTVKQDLKAFIDDVNLFIGKPSTSTKEEFIAAAQEDIDNWHGILRATGGKLNTKKCFWSNFELQFDTQGTPSLCNCQPQDPKLYLTQTNGAKTELHHTQSTEGIRHLGVHISMDGNQKAEKKHSTSAAACSSRSTDNACSLVMKPMSPTPPFFSQQ